MVRLQADTDLQERRVRLQDGTALLLAETHEITRGRVGRGGCPPRPPTDPDVQISRIRLFGIRDSLRGGRPNARLALEEVGSV
jgi:hypothetical protein